MGIKAYERDSASRTSYEKPVKEPKEEETSRRSSQMFEAVHEARSQCPPHFRQSAYEIVEVLNGKERVAIDRQTAAKVITALEILQSDYFPSEKLSPQNKEHFSTFQLLLAVQQESDQSGLEHYSKLAVENAKNHLENFKKKPVEDAKKRLRESKIIDGSLSSIPLAGPFFQEALFQATKPGEEARVGLQDLKDCGCFEGEARIISIEHLVPTAGCKLDAEAEQRLRESSAHHIFRLDGSVEEQAIKIQSIEEEIQDIREEISSSAKTAEEVEGNTAQAAEAEKEVNWHKALTQSFVCIANAARAFNDSWDQLRKDKEINEAKTREFLKAAKKAQEELDRDNRAVASLINTRSVLENVQQNRKGIAKIEAILEDIEGFIKERSQIAASGDLQVERLRAINEKIQGHYARLKEEQQKLRERFGYISLATRVIGGGLSAFPATQLAGAAVTIVGEMIHGFGTYKDMRLSERENHYMKLADSYFKISSDLGAVLRDNHGKILHLAQEKEHLTSVLFSRLQMDPSNYVKYRTYLENADKENSEKLAQLNGKMSEQLGLLAHKESAVQAAGKYLQDKNTSLFFNEGTKKEEEAQKKVDNAQAKLNAATVALTAQEAVIQNLKEEKKSLELSGKSLEESLEYAKRIQSIQETHADYLEHYNVLIELLGNSPSDEVEQAFQNIRDVSLLNQQGRQSISAILYRTHHLAAAFDGLFDTKVSEKIRKPTLAISKATTIMSGLIQLTHAYNTVHSFFIDREKTYQEALANDPSSRREPINAVDIIKFGARLIDPTSTVFIAGLELLSLFNEHERPPSEVQQMTRELAAFRLEVSRGFQSFHLHLGQVHQDVVERLNEQSSRLNLLEESLVQEMRNLERKIESVADRQSVILALREIGIRMGLFRASKEMTSYRLYVKEHSYSITPKTLKKLLHFLMEKIDQMEDPKDNGLWINRFDPSTHLTLASIEPEHCMALISQHTESGLVPSFYQYEHYTYMFVHLALKALLDESLEGSKQEIATVSQALIAQGKAIEAFFDFATVRRVLEGYLTSREGLIQACIEGEKRQIYLRDQRMVCLGQEWLQRAPLLRYYKGSSPGTYTRSLDHTQRFSSLRFLHGSVLSEHTFQHVNRKVYNLILKQDLFDAWSRTEVLGGKLGDTVAYIPYLGSISFDAFLHGGSNADSPMPLVGDEFVENLSALDSRFLELPLRVNEVLRLQGLSFLELLTRENIQKITVLQRGQLQGNFLEVAYRAGGGSSLYRRVQFCNHSDLDSPSINPLHRNTVFPSDQYGGRLSFFEIADYVEASHSIPSTPFSERYAFSVIQTSENQTQRGLKGRTFLVLSDSFNLEGLLTHILREQELIEPKRCFDFDARSYIIRPTSLDGVSPLHALLGIDQEGIYHYGDRAQERGEENSGKAVRSHFAKTLQERKDIAEVKNAFVNALKSHLNNVDEDPFSQRLFGAPASSKKLLNRERMQQFFIREVVSYGNFSLEELGELRQMGEENPEKLSIQESWQFLASYYDRCRELLKQREATAWLSFNDDDAFMQTVMEQVRTVPADHVFYQKTQEEVIEIAQANPILLLRLVDEISDASLRVIKAHSGHYRAPIRDEGRRKHNDAANGILRLREIQRNLNQERTQTEENFLLSDEVMNHYLDTVSDRAFFFNTDELHLAAVLFNKKVQIVSTQKVEEEDKILPAEQLFNPTLPGAPLLIYHEGNHFERCLSFTEIPHVRPTALQWRAHSKDKYDASVNKLVTDYIEFLKVKHGHPLEDPEVKPSNKFLNKEDFKNVQFLLPLKNKAHLPLAFPQAFLNRLEKGASLHDLNRIPVQGGGLLIPYYDFAFNIERDCYELSIEYQISSPGALQPLPQEYCRFVVAQIGKDTVEAFWDEQTHPDDPEEAKEFFHTPFLIQAMYTHFSEHPMLPGKLSYRLLQTNATTVIPTEEPFAGLFQKLFEVAIAETPILKKVVFNQWFPRLDPKQLLIHNPAAISKEARRGYEIIEKARFVARNHHREEMQQDVRYQEAERHYILLKTFLKLILDESAYGRVLKRVESPAAIIGASQDVKMFSEEQEKDAKKNEEFKTKGLVEAVVETYETHPTTERLRLQSHLNTLSLIHEHAASLEQKPKESLVAAREHASSRIFSDYGT